MLRATTWYLYSAPRPLLYRTRALSTAPPDRITFFWTDIRELKDGRLLAFGKIQLPNDTGTQSCMIRFINMHRTILLQPRPHVTEDEVRKEMQQRLLPGTRVNLGAIQRRYAFELPNVPRDTSTYWEITYPITEKQPTLPLENGSSYLRAFGTNQSAVENFILSNKLMGPGWLSVPKAKPIMGTNEKYSLCQHEYEVDLNDLNDRSAKIESVSNIPPPTMRVLSLAMQYDATKSTRYATGLSCHFHNSVALEGAPPKLGDVKLLRTWTMRNEEERRNAIAALSNAVHEVDPDMLVGFNIEDMYGDLHQIRNLTMQRPDVWTKMGRLKNMDRLLVADAKSHIPPGRLVLDTLKFSKEHLLALRDYSLPSICRTVNLAVPAGVKALDSQEAHDVSLLSLALAFKLEAIPLTWMLTTIGGNLWRRTLAGGRAERIEYLLMHAFHDKEYVCPDKGEAQRVMSATVAAASSSDDNGDGAPSASYQGGLVLTPSIGLYHYFIAVLDFNSLYPSIIQEYNICFTTVKRGDGKSNDEIAPLPEKVGKDGLAVLPTVIKGLVDKRTAVRKLMTNETDPVRKKVLDVTQKALKITANSMYGCLGFSASRFYAKPLASLVTHQGREILSKAVQSTEDMKLNVIYGDTDSIMIDTKLKPTGGEGAISIQDLDRVKEMAKKVEQKINVQGSALRIGTDAIFCPMLLLRKKKYAGMAIGLTTDSSGVSTVTRSVQIKGLDLVRRDWCLASTALGNLIVTRLLSGTSVESQRTDVLSIIGKFAKDVREGGVNMGQFAITKSLSKNPTEYAAIKGKPHVQVALAMIQKGVPGMRKGDFVQYVICDTPRQLKMTNEDEEGKPPQYGYDECAHQLDEAIRLRLKIDIDWYMLKQLLPPTVRLVCPVKELKLSPRDLADAFGMNVKESVLNKMVKDLEKAEALEDEEDGEDGEEKNESTTTVGKKAKTKSGSRSSKGKSAGGDHVEVKDVDSAKNNSIPVQV